MLGAFLATLLLAACASPAPETDPQDSVQVVWLRVEDVQKTCERLSGRKQFLTVLGCSRWSVERRRCEIYAPAPRSEGDTERFATLGHEFMHCFEGNWHDRWGRMHDEVARQASAGGDSALQRIDRGAE